MTQGSILNRIRTDVRAMQPYLSARYWTAPSPNDVLLDANELPYDPLPEMPGLNRYDDQQPAAMMNAVSGFLNVPVERLLVSRGGDEAIDLLVRLFCTPGQDSILISPPAFPMYPRAAAMNGTALISVPLEADFSLDIAKVLAAVREDTKLVFVCSPHNPVGVSVPMADIETLCEKLAGRTAVVLDEAYIDYAEHASGVALIDKHENLIVIRTLSKAMALAGARVGGMVARKEIIAEARKVLAVYPTPVPVTNTVLKALAPENVQRMAAIRAEIIATKKRFMARLENAKVVRKVFPSDSNFVLVRFADAAAVDKLARSHGFIMRNQSGVPGLENCIRITIGKPDDMDRLADLIAAMEA